MSEKTYYVQLFTGNYGIVNDYWGVKENAFSEEEAVLKAVDKLHEYKSYLNVVKVKIGDSAFTLKNYEGW